MKKIPLTRGKFALVDNDDFDYLNQWKWYCSALGYAIRGVGSRSKVRHIWMHREVNKTPEGLETDHINNNKLDNRKENLRTVTHSQNIFNRLNARNTSGQKGVTWHRGAQKWMAQIHANGVHYYLGLYSTIEQATATYEKAAEKYHGQYSRR